MAMMMMMIPTEVTFLTSVMKIEEIKKKTAKRRKAGIDDPKFPLPRHNPDPWQRSPGGRKVGVSLLETIVALSILAVFAFGIIQVFRQSGIRGENFSSEHFTAMFICQKVLEDINTRVQENPHFFDQLVASASGEVDQVVDGKSAYFDLLENTINFSYLDPAEDRAIDSRYEAAYRQLKDFKIQVECRLDVPADPVTGQPFRDLIEVIVTVFWNDVSGNQKYSVSQYLHGVSKLTFENLSSPQLEPYKEADAAWGLWWWLASGSVPTPPTFSSFMSYNDGGDPKVVKAVGDVLYFSLFARKIGLTYGNYLQDARTKRDQCLASASDDKKRAALYQERIGQLYEQKAAELFGTAARIRSSVQFLLEAPLSESTLGPKIFQARNNLRGRCWSVNLNIEEIQNSFAAAEDEYLKLQENPYKADYPERKVTLTIRRILDIEKIGVIILKGSGDLGDSLTQLQNRISAFNDSFRGLQPVFVDYLVQEAGICRSLDSLEAYFGGSTGFTGLIQQVMDIKDSMFELERKLK